MKSHSSPDEVRTPNKTRVEVVQLEGFTIGRFNFEPGWRWSECVKPVVKTDQCQVSHVGYAVSGNLLGVERNGHLRPGRPRQRRNRDGRHRGHVGTANYRR